MKHFIFTLLHFSILKYIISPPPSGGIHVKLSFLNYFVSISQHSKADVQKQNEKPKKNPIKRSFISSNLASIRPKMKYFPPKHSQIRYNSKIFIDYYYTDKISKP